MGCVQARGPNLGSPDEGRLDALKRANGYMPARDVRHLSVQSSRRDREDGEPEEGRGGGGGGGGGGEGGGEGGGRRGLTEGGENEGEVLRTSVTLPQPVRQVDSGDDELVDGWPRWLLSNVPPEVLAGLVPKSADNYEKLDKVGQGTYSNVYKARDRDTGKIVALKKVRFDTSEPESVKFMAREIMILQKLDHPNVIKLEGLATSRMHYSIYLVFDFMLSDLARIISRPDTRLTEPQVKSYMKQLLSGLQHCHERDILHRDIKGSNLLIDKNGVLKIADFGLANFYYPKKKVPLTSRVVTLWYRAPELLLGTTDYGHGIDLWSAGCLLAEMFAGRPIMPGRNEIEQLHKIFMLCGSPSDDYWKKLKLANRFQPPPPYKPSIAETFKDLPSSALILLTVLLSLDPANRGTAASALESHFFTTSPLACDLSGLPVIYNEVDELIQPRERKKKSVLKLTQQSRRERYIQTKLAALNIKGYSGSSKEPADLGRTNPGSTNQELGGNAGSTSSSIKPQKSTSVLGSSFSQITCPYEEDSQRAEDYPSGPRNIKNFSPKLEWNVDSYDLGKRSSSTVDLGRFPGRHMSRVSPDMQ